MASKMPGQQSDNRFGRINRERIADRVAHELQRLIACGDLSPGERLPGERQLAAMMDVSRVSVRAALQQLKAQGVVATVQGGGTRVLPSHERDADALRALVRYNRENLRDLAEIRAGIEVWAAKRAAERASDEQIAGIVKAFEIMSQPERPAHFKAVDDFHFHLAIARASASPVYLHLMQDLEDILSDMFAYHRGTLQVGEEYDHLLLEQHRAICEAIHARDPVAAATAMAAHLDTVLLSYPDHDTAPAGGAAGANGSRHD